jgi:hypothetical protein
MNASKWNKLGIIAIILAIIFSALAVGTASGGVEEHVRNNYSRISSGTYSCTGTVQDTANEIAKHDPPIARQFDSATGTEYLRYKRRVVSVAQSGSTNCTITIENLDRFNNGAFIFLGPGFTPSAPSRSSGGSSGSGGISGSGNSSAK